ncbi:GNAT family N-acetyltransferase [Deinococcus altitudinis]|uniref:GNAT family N-acetyltransferase n=1 Tax=Deinococcus altitudinis TaxID=468914 RepID=UPI003891B43E
MIVILRAVKSSDLPAAQALIQASFDARLHPYMISTQAGAQTYLRVFIDHASLYPDRRFLLAETEDGALLGYAEFRLVEPFTGFLSYICVAPSARGQGVATQLIQHYLEEVPQARTVQLDVFTHNSPALALYRKLGFVSGEQNVWWIQDLNASASPQPISFSHLPTALASLEQYGFCELSGNARGHPFRLGIMGERVLRCFDAQLFADTPILASVAATFPQLREVLAILPDTGLPPAPQAREINRSVRMTWALPPHAQELR